MKLVFDCYKEAMHPNFEYLFNSESYNLMIYYNLLEKFC